MNVDELTAKFAQAYTKRADGPTFTSQQLAPLGSEDITSAVRDAQNAPAYLGRATPSGGGLLSDAGTPFQVQSGPTGTMSGAPKLLARPIETQQSYGMGAFLDPTNAGFYSPFLDVPFVGDDQSGFGTGASLLSGAGSYGATRALLNRALLDPRNYFKNVDRTPINMTPEGADRVLARSLGIGPTEATPKLEAKNSPLRANQSTSQGTGIATQVDTVDPAALRASMASQGMTGPGVSPSSPIGVGPVQITSTNPASGAKGSKPVTTTATFNPQVPLLRPGSRIPTAAGVRAAVAPTALGGMPTGARGSLRGRAPLYAALAGMTVPQLFNTYNMFAAPNDPTGNPLSGFAPRVGYNPAVLGKEQGFFYNTPMLYEDVIGRDVPVR